MDQEPFKKGQRAYCMMSGWGTITDTNSGSNYPILFSPDADAPNMVFTADGRYYKGIGERVLFHEKPVITEFEPEPEPLPELEVDAHVWVRHANCVTWEQRHFSGWSEKGNMMCFPDGLTSHSCGKKRSRIEWQHYSLTDPNEN